MRKKGMALLTSAVLTAALFTGMVFPVSADDADISEETENGAVSAEDQEAADRVAAMIDAIYVQERTEDTDSLISEAKAGWDALTDAQKELVEGEEADPDYFGKDTGDASLDDPRNGDDIGENELLVVSFGTSFNTSRAEDIGGIEKTLAAAYPDWSVRRAFTAQIIINHIQARDGEVIDNMDQALERAVENGVRNLIIQPTHLMQGAEYDELCAAVDAYRDQFETTVIGRPLLGEVGADETEINSDKETVAKAVVNAALTEAGYDSTEAAAADGLAIVLMGHGTSHSAAVTYDQMQTQMEALGFENVFIGTVEGKPEDTECDAVIEKIREAGYTKVLLRPLMVVAGDHANNDMADPEDPESWLSRFTASGAFENVDVQIAGMGRIPEVQAVYVAHAAAAIGEESEAKEETGTGELPDGTYLVDVTTDSSMFHVNEADKGKGVLTVEDGQMTVYFRVVSKNILNLFSGSAEDAQKDGAVLIEPKVDTVTYDDGMSEEVHGFSVPVPSIGEEFPVALIGSKGKWYDHMICVSNPEASAP